MTIPSANEGLVYVGLQSAKGTAATTLYGMYLTSFEAIPDEVSDEGEAEIGHGMDVATVERYGFNGMTIRGSMRFRPGNVGILLRGFGLSVAEAGAGPRTFTYEPYTASSSFPYLSFVDKFDASSTLDLLITDVWLSSLTVRAEERAPLRLDFEGRALDWTSSIGSPTLNSEVSGVLTPNTSKGTLTWGGSAYKMNTMTVTYAWNEALATSLTNATIDQVLVGGRNVTFQADVHLGANTANLFEEVYHGGDAETDPSTSITEKNIQVTFQSGGVISGSDYYEVRLGMTESQLRSYTIPQDGDSPVLGGLSGQVTRESTEWNIVLQNNQAADYYD